MQHKSTKTYGHEIGLSCCFRQWRAKSHCQFFHGYALSVKLEFSTGILDENFWVVDFGSLKPIKAWLEKMFDHKLLVASDDPMLRDILELESKNLAQVVVVENIGCEAFSTMIYRNVNEWLNKTGYAPRVSLVSVEVREHGANSGVFSQ
jgi:6-pyruvoyltetrahydropterin/6-carboxytetrahydropterin synthase